MLFRVMSRWVVICSLLLLAACGGGSGGQEARTVTLAGQVVNGPLDGATVTVANAEGEVLATATTDEQGYYTVVLTAPPGQLRLTATGGQLAGNPYTGVLSAICAVPGSGSGLSCHVTPYSSIAARLVEDHGMTLTAANAALFAVFRLSYDPFIRDIGPSGPVATEYFDIDAARTAINGGDGLDTWLDALTAWVNTPFVGMAPPGTPVYNIVATIRTGSGSVTPPSQQVAMGGQAVFTVTAGANHVVDRITGCGGALVGDVYTTAPITSVGATTGVCSVEVRFALEKFPVEYIATEGGAIVGTASQLVSFGGSTTEVEAEAETGYFFVDWSDGSTDETRIDTNITGPLTLEARFQRESYTLEYAAGPNGSLSGVLEQTVLFGDSGSAVTAIPDPGYVFIRWSDGPVSNPRLDSNVAKSIDVTAIFEALPASTPFLQGLHFGDMSIDIIGPSRAQVSWPAEVGVEYDLFISPTADVVLDQYASFGAELRLAVQPPVVIDDLIPGEPVYVVVRAQGETEPLTSSSFVPRSWGFDGEVLAQARDGDGNLLMGGRFGLATQNLASLAAFPPAYSTATTVHPLALPEVDGVIHVVEADGFGGWYIGGQFSSVNGEPRQNLARLDKSGQLTDWSAYVQGGVDARVLALYVIETTVIVGGKFTVAGSDEGSSARLNLVIFDQNGDVLADWSPDVNGEVSAITLDIPLSLIYIGGQFTSVDGQPRSNLAAINLTGDPIPWTVGTNGPVRRLVARSGRLYVGGEFSAVTVGGTPSARAGIAQLSTAGALQSWAPVLTHAVSPIVYDLDWIGSNLVIGGRFSSVDGNPRSSVAVFGPSLDLLATGFGVDGDIRAIMADEFNNRIYLAGEFSRFFMADDDPGVLRSGIAAISSTSGVVNLIDWKPGLNGAAHAVGVSAGVPLVGGTFLGVSPNVQRNRLAALDADGNLLDWAPVVDGDVRALAVDGDQVYVAGEFEQVRASASVVWSDRENLAAFDRLTGALLGWNPGVLGGAVEALLLVDGALYAGGSFTTTGTMSGELSRQRLAAFDETGLVLPWQPAVDDTVRALVDLDGVIYVGGDFLEAGEGFPDTDRLRLAAFSLAGELSPWDPGVNGRVLALATLDGAVIAAGDFSSTGPTSGDLPRQRLAAFDEAATVMGWNPGANGSVRGLASAADTLYLVGDFTEVGASAELRLGTAAVDLSGDVLPWYPAEAEGASGVLFAAGELSVIGNFRSVTSTDDQRRYSRGGLFLASESGVLGD